jgi:CRP/FNR family transcriptional regulator, polysaccharide utilization system transcription regulator
MNSIKLLKDCFFVDWLTEEEQQRLDSNLTKVQYSKGEKIIKSGEFVTHAIFVVKGYVKIHSETRNKTIILNIIGPNSFSGLSAMISRKKHEFNITALDDSLACLINIDVLLSFIETNGAFARGLVEYMNSTMLHYINHNIITLTQNNIHGRLANTLLYLSEQVFASNSFDMLLSRKELSQFSNVSRENVIKVLYEFSSDGLIKLNSKQIQILNLEQLKRLAKIC